MKVTFSIEQAVNQRSSVRNYKQLAIDPTTQTSIEDFIKTLDNPFNKKVNFHFLTSEHADSAQKLGTYGVIKGAKQFIGTTIQQEPMALESLGYELEVVMLYLANIGLGTCWLGGTFNRKGFAKAMEVGENEFFPVITPYGYASDKKHFQEIAMRKMIKADQRKPWDVLFFHNDFNTPLSKEVANEFAFPLEMVRLGPSASNKQPWRILLAGNICHFFEAKDPGYSSSFPYDIQRIDLGIAAAHFDLSVSEMGIKGHFTTLSQPDMELPNHVEYVFSWIKEE